MCMWKQSPADVCVCFPLFIILLEWGKDGFKVQYTVHQANCADWISFLPSNPMKKIALIQMPSAQIPKAFHQQWFRHKWFNIAKCIAYLHWKSVHLVLCENVVLMFWQVFCEKNFQKTYRVLSATTFRNSCQNRTPIHMFFLVWVFQIVSKELFYSAPTNCCFSSLVLKGF